MVATPHPDRLTPEAYLEWEVQQDCRYEYLDGQVFAMTGGSLPHADIALNIATTLRASLNKRCKVRNSDAKVGITDAGPFVYPDVSVTCDDRDRTAQAFSRYPCLIAEVMSPSTEAYDRGGKFALYRRIDTLQTYILVSSEAQTVDVFQRQENGVWTFMSYSAADEIPLPSLDLTLRMPDIYDDVVFESPDS